MRIAALYILLLLGCFYGQAQSPYTSKPKGNFTVSEVRGCRPFTITINAPSCGNPSCDAFYEDDNTSVSISPTNPSGYTHTYTKAGTYILKLLKVDQIDTLHIIVYDSIPPDIEVLNCGGNRVSVNILDNNYFQYEINYNDGQPNDIVSSSANPQHDYAAGNQMVTVRGLKKNAAINCPVKNESVTVINNLIAPTINRLEVINNAAIAMNFVTAPNVQYKLEIGVNNGTSFQQIKALYNESADTVLNLKPDDNFYCFRLGAYDPCGNQTSYSPVVCSSNFDLEVQNNLNRVTWINSTAGSISQTLNIRRPSLGVTRSSPNAISPYNDTEVVCGTEYCYRLAINYPGGGQSLSLEKCGVAISNDIPEAISNITTIVSDDGLELEWQQPQGFTPDLFSVYKSISNDFGLLDTVAAYTLVDAAYTTESGSCYKIEYTDVCGNKSPQSEVACPIQLSGSLASNNDINLSWTAYEGFENDVAHYTVEKYTAAGTLLESTDVSATTYTDASKDLDVQLYVYVVKAVPKITGFPPSVSNRVVIIKDPNLFYPSGFTPNGDNLNDLFNVYGQYITSFQMDIKKL
jgi:hypothetical protein